MKRNWLSVLAIIAVTLSVWGGLPAQRVTSAPQAPQAILLDENFDYGGTAGALTTASSSSWSAHSGAGTNPIQYVTPSLLMLGYGSSGLGGAATFAAVTGEDVNRTIVAQSSGTIYGAALVNISAAKTAGDYFFHFRDTGTGFRARVFARDSSGSLQFGVSNGSATTVAYGATNFSYNKTYLLVVKYDITNMSSTLFVLNAHSATEPVTPLATASDFTTFVNISSVVIRQGAAANAPAGKIDGIRVATTWAEAVGNVLSALVINEIMYHPSTNSGNDEWFEVKNATNSAINPNGCTITDGDGGINHTISGAPNIAADGYYVFAAAAGISGVTANYVYGGGGQLTDTGSGDTITIACGGNTIDSVGYQVNQNGWPASAGVSIAFGVPTASSGAYHLDNDSGSNWGDSTSSIGGGNTDLGTPGTRNNDVLAPNAVTLSDLSASTTASPAPVVFGALGLVAAALLLRRKAARTTSN